MKPSLGQGAGQLYVEIVAPVVDAAVPRGETVVVNTQRNEVAAFEPRLLEKLPPRGHRDCLIGFNGAAGHLEFHLREGGFIKNQQPSAAGGIDQNFLGVRLHALTETG